MRIGQLAEAAGTTTRTVRHYHRLGLMEEPHRLPNGYREYSIEDAVRLIRIRWLAESGVPLGSVATILGEDPREGDDRSDVVDDLEALIASVDAEQARLARRRTRLAEMLSAAESGGALSALPADLARAFTEAIDTAESPALRAILQRERDMFEVLAIAGKAPEDLLESVASVMSDSGARKQYLTFLAQWSRLEGREPESVENGIELLVERLIDTFHDQGIAEGLSARLADTDGGQEPPIPLTEIVSDPAQREVVLRVLERLNEATAPAPRDAR